MTHELWGLCLFFVVGVSECLQRRSFIVRSGCRCSNITEQRCLLLHLTFKWIAEVLELHEVYFNTAYRYRAFHPQG